MYYDQLMIVKMSSRVNEKIWDEHWAKKKGVRNIIFEKVVSFYRRSLIATQVRVYIDRYFPQIGIFLELGSGTSESSIRILKRNRLLGAVDFSPYALSRAKKISVVDFYIQADIFKLPLKDESIDGIWNVGVMEHFTEDELIQILREFNRVLRENRCCILFWPWILAPSHLIFSSYERILKGIGIHKQIFPETHSMFKRHKTVEKILKKAGFVEIKFHPPLFDLTHWVVVGCKAGEDVN